MNRIAQIRITPIALKDPPLLNASGVHEPFTLRSIIEIESTDGQVGLAETYGDDDTLLRLQAVAPHLHGIEGHDLAALADAVRQHGSGRQASTGPDVAPGAKAERALDKVFAGFETGFADLNARSAGLPLADWLGGRRIDRVPYSAYLFYKFGQHHGTPYDGDDAGDPWGEVVDADAMVRLAQTMVRQYGFGSIKLKAGVFEPDQEADALLALHDAFPNHPLRIDPNGNWSLDTALRVADKVGSALEYYEDPVPTLADMAELNRRTGLMLATNMVVCDRGEFAANVGLGTPIRTILSDHHFWPGFRATRDLAALCDTFGLKLSMHSNSHAGISLMAMTHLAASTPGLAYACDTHYPWQSEDVIQGGRVAFVDGAVVLSDAPGIGVELDRNALAALHEQYLRCGVRSRNDTREMQKHRPGFVKRKPRF
ncbi:MAG: enolase C-terminal domain-like protein [Rubrivivax sp.]